MRRCPRDSRCAVAARAAPTSSMRTLGQPGTAVPELTVTPGSASRLTAAKSDSASGVATSINASTRLGRLLV